MTDPTDDALMLQAQAAAEGFDWSDPQDLWVKLQEEISELRAAKTPTEQTEELGDLLFMVLNIARHLKLDPRAALIEANGKFARRYAVIEAALPDLAPRGDRRRLEQMETLWQQAKRSDYNSVTREGSGKNQ